MKYLAYYDTSDNVAENRNYVLAASNKVTYICSAINRAGIPVEIISASASWNPKGCRGKTVRVLDNTTLKLFSCMGTGGLLKKLVGRTLFKLNYFLYLFFRIRKNEKVIVYHGMGYGSLIILLKRLKRFHLILEVEEIYADVSGREDERKKEFRLFQMADAYIFPAQRMNDLINTEGKPYTLICGTYQAEKDREVQFENPQWKDKTHCVYAGTFDSRKGGGQIAAEVARYLPAEYHIHLLGFGSQKDMQNIEKTVEEISGLNGCGISYDGCLRGEEYIRFLQCCQVGMSTQNPNATFNDTSFPSKILSYMANGLQVVTARIPVVEESPVGQWMHYYDESTPEKIAQAIMTVKTDNSNDGRCVLENLDKEFIVQIKKLLS